jgi:hypothetical protein
MTKATTNHPSLRTTNIIALRPDEFIEKYQPIPNHIRPDASCEGWTGNVEDNGILFQTYGEEKAFVFSQPKNLVWSYVEGKKNGIYITNAFVDWKTPIGYLVCRVPYNVASDIEVEVIPDCAEDCQCQQCCAGN